jgi:plastocyanin
MVLAMRYLLAVAAFFVLSAPAMAATKNVKAEDDFFDPQSTSAALGDTVRWRWTGVNDHTVQTRRRQIDRFDSGIRSRGATFSHTFRYPGRFRYFCEIHFGMVGTVTAGSDNGVRPRITRVAASARRVRFRLSERSVVTLRLRGRRRIVKVLGRGRRSIRFRRLAEGSHRASLSAKDGFGRIGRRSKRFSVG